MPPSSAPLQRRKRRQKHLRFCQGGIKMYRVFCLILIEIVLFGSSYLSCGIFLESRNFKRGQRASMLFLLFLCLIAFGWVFPDLLYDKVAFFTPILLVLPCGIFYLGSFLEKLSVILILYLASLGADVAAATASFYIEYFIKGETVSGNLLPSAPVHTLFTYIVLLSTALLSIHFFIFPNIRRYMTVFRRKLFFRLTLPFILIYIASNLFLSFIYVSSVPLFFTAAAGFAVIISVLVRLALRSVRFFMKKGQERDLLLIEQEQFDQQRASSEMLYDEYKRLRRISHDISGHYLSLSSLMDNEKWQETENYIQKLFEKKESST